MGVKDAPRSRVYMGEESCGSDIAPGPAPRRDPPRCFPRAVLER